MAILSPQCPNSCFNNAFLKDSSSGELLKREQRIRAFFLSSMSCGSFVKKDSPFVILSRSVFLQFSIIPSTNPNLPSSIKLFRIIAIFLNTVGMLYRKIICLVVDSTTCIFIHFTIPLCNVLGELWKTMSGLSFFQVTVSFCISHIPQ